jgi:hypothetical protein
MTASHRIHLCRARLRNAIIIAVIHYSDANVLYTPPHNNFTVPIAVTVADGV